ncbi:MAG: hypothetical protein HXX13_16120 [Bacteroidetes bacterium]|nr:hypothetical protein [Bacteroidota bacterium]
MKNHWSFYKAETTFRPEYAYLNKYIPHALDNQCARRQSFQTLLPEGFIDSIVPWTENLDTISPVSPELHIEQINTSLLLDTEIYDANKLIEFLDKIGSSDLDPQAIRNLVSLYGTEAFGLYLPFHYYHNCDWGIYLFPEILKKHAEDLFEYFKTDKYTREETLLMYFFAVYRHELYHYQTERYATKLELTTHRSHYKALAEIDKEVHHSPNWLSEALAEATVLNSLLVSNRSHMPLQRIQKVYSWDLQNMPSGYRDHACESYGGPNKAQLYFASQIKEMKVKPESILPDLFTVKGEFSSNDRDVPLYVVTGFNKIRRLYL